MNKPNRLPVTLLTGFLGSGKTTVLNHFISKRPSERILVIENEVGQTNVDGALVEPGVEEVVELSAGCLCCSLSDGLLEALRMVSTKQNKFDRLVIETTGVADPGSIVQVFMAHPFVERFFNLEQVVCVVDAGNVEDWLRETEEALRQIAMADVVLLNKADTVSADYLNEVTLGLYDINPHALIMSGVQGQFPIAKVVNTKISEAYSFENRLARVDNQHQLGENPTPGTRDNRHKVNTFTLVFDNPFVLDDHFSLQLYRLVNLYREQVYRIKGILNVADVPNRVILQSVRTSCVLTDGSPWQPGESRKSKLVFIGRGLKKEAFEKMFNRFTQTVKS